MKQPCFRGVTCFFSTSGFDIRFHSLSSAVWTMCHMKRKVQIRFPSLSTWLTLALWGRYTHQKVFCPRKSWLELSSYWCERPNHFSSGCSPSNISYSEKILGLKEYVAIAVCIKPLCECTSLYPVVPTVVSGHLKQKEQGRALETTVWAEEEKEIVTYHWCYTDWNQLRAVTLNL